MAVKFACLVAPVERLVGKIDDRLLVLYGRVSERGQMGDLDMHLERIQTWAKWSAKEFKDEEARIRSACIPRQSWLSTLRKREATARFVWNWALAEWNRLYEAGEKPSAWKLKKQFNQIRREHFPWT
jgi:hypothetical protein